MSLLIALVVKISHSLAGISFIFLKKRLRQNLNDFQYKFGPQLKDRDSGYQVK